MTTRFALARVALACGLAGCAVDGLAAGDGPAADDAVAPGGDDNRLPDAAANPLPTRDEIVSAMRRVNDLWLHSHVDPGANGWTRATYFEGNMAMVEAYPDDKYLRYAVAWGDRNGWALSGGAGTRHADNQCAGQTYIDLYRLDPEAARISMIEASLEAMLAGDVIDDWTWVDALQMAMPTFAKLGALRGDPRYFDRLYQMYDWTKHHQGGGLYSQDDHLWWRDARFKSITAPNGEDVYWSRGNGWVLAAHVRTLAELPADDPHRAEYLETFEDMAEALAAVQHDDGFWSASLHDPDHEGGPETSGTAFFTYGLAWGVRHGHLDPDVYIPIIARAWRAMVDVAVQPDGRLGYVQPVGDRPAPTGVDDSNDYGVGAFLLAGSEVLALAPGDMSPVASDVNAAIDRAVTASAEQEGNEATRAVDGDDFTRWSAFGYPQSLEVDLGERTRIGAVEIAPRDQRAYRFRVETRETADALWQTAVDDRDNDEHGALLQRSFAPRDARFVRLTVTGVADGSTDWVSILELRVLESVP